MSYNTYREDVKDEGSCFLIDVVRKKNSGNKKKSTFAITDDHCCFLLRCYIGCFPPAEREGRFFRKVILDARTGKMKGTLQVLGVNTIGTNMRTIATWCGVPNPEKSTSHANRRMGASLLAEGGASLTMIKCAGGWKSSTACEGYIADSMLSKRKVCDTMDINPMSTKKQSGSNKENIPPSHGTNNPTTNGCYSNCTFFIGGAGAGASSSSSMAARSSSSSSSSHNPASLDVGDDDESVSLKLLLPIPNQ